MKQTGDVNVYEGLASYFLPEGALNYFEVVDFAVQPTSDKDVLYTTELHIYLDERDNRPSGMKGESIISTVSSTNQIKVQHLRYYTHRNEFRKCP